MRILIDTNVLFSSILLPDSKLAKVVIYIAYHHHIVLCEQNISELRDAVSRKYPHKLKEMEIFLTEFRYELIPSKNHVFKEMHSKKDQAILNAAIAANVDVILTGDNDFLRLALEYPRCMNIAQFMKHEGLNL